MAQTTLNMTLLLRRVDFTVEANANWKPSLGEPCYCTSTKMLKIGDGEHTWAELPFANEAQIKALIKEVNDKVEALNDTYATDAEVEAIRAALAAATEAVANRVTAIETSIASGDVFNAIADAKKAGTDAQTYAEGVASDLADYESANDSRVEAIEDEIDTFGDIVTHNVAEFATAEQGAKADAAAVKTVVDEALAARYTKTEADQKFETIANVDLVRGDITNITKDGGLIATAKSEAIAAAKTETETQISTLKTTVIDPIDGRLEDVEDRLDNVSNVMDFVGAGAALPAVETSNKGDVFVISEGDDAGKEFVFDGEKWVEFGFATANENAISALQGRMDTAEADIDKLQEDLAQEVADRKAADEALGGRIDTLSGTVTENKNTYDAYVLANDARVKAVEDNIAALDNTYATDDELAGAVSTINGTITEKVAELKKYAEDEADAAETAAKSYTDTEISDFNTETVAPIAARVKAIEDAPYTAKKYVDDQDAATLDAAKAYTDTEISDFNTETIVPLTGRVSDLEAAVDAIDVGVTKVVAGNDIVVTPTEGTGVVTVAHETFTTGEYAKDPATSDKTGDEYFFTSVTVDNGHVTGANVKSLASVLEAMTFILDGGSSIN